MKKAESRTMRDKLRAVHDDDLESLLQALGVYGKFSAGKLTCSFCKDAISQQNLHSVFPDSGAIKFCCSRPGCVRALVSRMEKKDYG